jgi:hypothetical protein
MHWFVILLCACRVNVKSILSLCFYSTPMQLWANHQLQQPCTSSTRTRKQLASSFEQCNLFFFFLSSFRFASLYNAVLFHQPFAQQTATPIDLRNLIFGNKKDSSFALSVPHHALLQLQQISGNGFHFKIQQKAITKIV